LLAGVSAELRRRQSGEAPAASSESSLYEFAGWRLDVARRDLRDPGGAYIDLTDGEFALLRCFVQSPQRVLNRDQLLDQAQAIREVLGEEFWSEVRSRAAREDLYEGQALGKVLGQLAREALEKKGKR
jgi:DNA-binding response OmpR family regulator